MELVWLFESVLSRFASLALRRHHSTSDAIFICSLCICVNTVCVRAPARACACVAELSLLGRQLAWWIMGLLYSRVTHHNFTDFSNHQLSNKIPFSDLIFQYLKFIQHNLKHLKRAKTSLK